MSNAYNTDGPLSFGMDFPPIENAFESIECAIAFDVHEWSTSRRDAWIYSIVFGCEDDESWNYMCVEHGWDNEDRERAKRLHEQWKQAKAMFEQLQNSN